MNKEAEACLWSVRIPCELVKRALENPEFYVNMSSGKLTTDFFDDGSALIYEPDYGLEYCYYDPEHEEITCTNINGVIEKCGVQQTCG